MLFRKIWPFVFSPVTSWGVVKASMSKAAPIFSTHFIIDRFRIPKYLIWLREGGGYPMTDTGFNKAVPAFISTWLFIITDNAMHIIINYYALRFL